jgi:hypothetical protein
MPNGFWGEMRWDFDIYDQAGNKTRASAKVYVATKAPSTAPEPVAIYTGTAANYLGQEVLKGFEAYTPGMTIYQNPVRVLYRVPRAEYYGGGGNGDIYGPWVNPPPGPNTLYILYSDSNYLYLDIQGSTDGHLIDVTRVALNGLTGLRPHEFRLNVKFASEALRPPTPIKLEAYVEGLGKWVESPYHISKGQTQGATSAITQIRLSVAPRPYQQKFSMTGLALGTKAYSVNCSVPPMGTVCLINTNLPYPGDDVDVYHNRYAVTDETGQLRSTEVVPMWGYDGSPAQVNLETLAYDPRLKQIYYEATNDFKQRVWGRSRIVTQNLIFVNTHTGAETVMTPKATSRKPLNANVEIYGASFNYTSLPEGKYKVFAYVEDGFNASSLNKQRIPLIENVAVDLTPPIISISPPSGTTIGSLDDITITVTDEITGKPTVTKAHLTGGPANDDVYLAVRGISNTQFKLEYPVMFPSLKEGEFYTLTVEARDDQYNTSTASVTFDYQPRQVTLVDGMDGKVMVPAVPYAFTHADGRRIIETHPLTLSDGSTLNGTYDVFATLRSDAALALVVNGIRIVPGQTMRIMSQHDFESSAGRLSIPLYPAVGGIVGVSHLIVTTSAPNAPVLAVEIYTWEASAKLSAESWEVRQVIDPVRIYAMPEVGIPCRFTSKESEAKATDPIRDPVCLLEWDKTPDETEQAMQDNQGLTIAGLVGQALKLGEQPVAYSLYLFSGNGAKVKVGEGSHMLTVKPAYGAVEFQLDKTQVKRAIEEVNVRFVQTEGPECALTLNAERAKRDAANKPAGLIARTCLFEWQQIPDSLTQDPYSEIPLLSGTLADNGAYTLGWRVSIYSKNGTRITLADQSAEIEAVDPPAPTIALASKYHFKDNIYLVPRTGQYLGDAVINAESADVDITLRRNSEVLEAETFSPGWGVYNRVYRRIHTDERTLWEETLYTVKAAYTPAPDVGTEADYRVIASPLENVKPFVEVASNTAIDTQTLPVKAVIRDQYNPTGAYDPNTMGVWKVRLIQQKAYNETEVLTDFVATVDGEAHFDVDLSNVETFFLRIAAEAVLDSPIEGYTRTEVSTRPAFLTVLRGGEIGADVIARRLSGEAPLTGVFKLSLQDREYARAVGDIVWETSDDEGQSWSEFVPEERYKYQLVKVFDKGEYQVRANVINRNSGREAYTETVSVIAYEKPQITVEGPQTLFIGSEGTYTAKVSLND